MNQIAILGATASGKSDLALKLADRFNATILSLDSLSIYKQIDIASAKPTKQERGEIVHVGKDEIFPNEIFNVMLFHELYKKAQNIAIENNQPLIIVGGTGFYLKSMVEGMSQTPKISDEVKQRVQQELKDIVHVDRFAREIDKHYKAEPNDRYRLEKWLEVYYQSNVVPSVLLLQTKSKPLIESIDIFEIDVDKEILRQRIIKRTQKMVQSGLVEEVEFLLQTYGREPQCMKSIGIKEVIEFLDGKLSHNEMAEWISIHTAQLAKRQRTFNKSQFKNIVKLPLERVFEEACLTLSN